MTALAIAPAARMLALDRGRAGGMKVALTAADVLQTFKQNGLRLTVISVASTICLGVVDQFTSRVIPSIASRIDNFVDPPRFFVSFNTPLDLANGVTLTALGAADGAPPVPVKKTGERALAAQAGPGVYELRVERTQNAVKQELVFELAFEGIQLSPRHRSGIAVRFPRMARWRHDKKAEEADSIETIRALLQQA